MEIMDTSPLLQLLPSLVLRKFPHKFMPTVVSSPWMNLGPVSTGEIAPPGGWRPKFLLAQASRESLTFQEFRDPEGKHLTVIPGRGPILGHLEASFIPEFQFQILLP